MNGLVQTTGWPSVVTCISNWFGKGRYGRDSGVLDHLEDVLAAVCGFKAVMSLPVRRGLIMGLWNSHTSVGNILGSLIAGYWVSSNWGLSFIVPGIIITVMGVVCFLFLIEREFSVCAGGVPVEMS